MSAVENPDAKLNNFFAKKKKKKSAVPAAAPASTSATTLTNSPVQAPIAAPKISSPSTKGAVIQTKGKTITDLKNLSLDDEEDGEEGEGELSQSGLHQWAKKPKKKTIAQPVDKKLAIHSERAFPTLSGAGTNGSGVPNVSVKTVKPPSDVRSQNVWASIDDSDEEDK